MSPEERKKRNERFRLRRERKKAMESSVEVSEPEAKIEVKESEGLVLIKNLLAQQNELLTKISKDLDFEFTAEKDEHILMGQEYGRLGTK